ncbi:hypothetical protein ACIG3E_23640 [Streptomyces sp. NPDC053474]|uniref:hypothetical protein n=1 Tax=Streptomyces sp. NPDC053474 TaxID=3365704 RepID=UPI0037D3EFDE
MAEQTTNAAKTAPADTHTALAPPPTGSFAPQISTHPVTALTLGSQKENDADKEWYFE